MKVVRLRRVHNFFPRLKLCDTACRNRFMHAAQVSPSQARRLTAAVLFSVWHTFHFLRRKHTHTLRVHKLSGRHYSLQPTHTRHWARLNLKRQIINLQQQQQKQKQTKKSGRRWDKRMKWAQNEQVSAQMTVNIWKLGKMNTLSTAIESEWVCRGFSIRKVKWSAVK